jgi:hypothetical protein
MLGDNFDGSIIDPGLCCYKGANIMIFASHHQLTITIL